MTTGEIEVSERPAQPVAAVRGHVATAGLAEFLGGAFGEVMGVFGAQGRVPAGPPYGRYRATGDGFDVEAGFPADGEVVPAGRVAPAELPGGPVATAMHRGDYGGVAETYDAITAWLPAHGYAPAGEPWESYLDGPEVAEPRTLVCFPVRPA
jgi:effector-binding domain-containing protein